MAGIDDMTTPLPIFAQHVGTLLLIGKQFLAGFGFHLSHRNVVQPSREIVEVETDNFACPHLRQDNLTECIRLKQRVFSQTNHLALPSNPQCLTNMPGGDVDTAGLGISPTKNSITMKRRDRER
jgi:hypothetical protein